MPQSLKASRPYITHTHARILCIYTHNLPKDTHKFTDIHRQCTHKQMDIVHVIIVHIQTDIHTYTYT